jgi:hypothetical protein
MVSKDGFVSVFEADSQASCYDNLTYWRNVSDFHRPIFLMRYVRDKAAAIVEALSTRRDSDEKWTGLIPLAIIAALLIMELTSLVLIFNYSKEKADQGWAWCQCTNYTSRYRCRMLPGWVYICRKKVYGKYLQGHSLSTAQWQILLIKWSAINWCKWIMVLSKLDSRSFRTVQNTTDSDKRWWSKSVGRYSKMRLKQLKAKQTTSNKHLFLILWSSKRLVEM